jgi:DNA-binding LacI/PurR family transcriptional regulator
MPSGKRKRVERLTIHDVAAEAGVSSQTVSRVINGSPSVKESTRNHVLEVVEALKFRPNRTAQNLARRRSRLIGLITYALSELGPTQVLVRLEEAARDRGFNVIVIDIKEMTAESIQFAVEELRDQQVAGIQFNLPLRIDFSFIREIASQLPMVIYDVALGPEVPSVVFKHRAASRLATNHLLDLGHQRIVHLSGPETWIAGHLRRLAFLETMKKRGNVSGFCLQGNWTAESGYQLALQLLRDYWGKFSAVLAGSDLMALGAMRAFYENGVKVPDQISVAGFSDIPQSAFFQPPLTTVRQDFTQFGQLGVECLLNAIDHPSGSALQRILEPVLVVRSSTRMRPHFGD